MPTTELNGPSRLYISVVVAAGLCVLLESIYSLLRAPVEPNWLVLAVLTLLSGSFTVRIPGIPARLSVSETFVFAAALLFGPPAATMIVVLDTLVISFWLGRQTSPPRSRVMFNVAASAVAIWVATHAFYYATQIEPLSIKPQPIFGLLPWLLLLATVYFILNSSLVAIVVGLHKRRSPITVWRQSFLWLSLNYFSGASVAALLLPYLVQSPDAAFMYVAGVILPVLIISYLTFKTALGRIEDATTHLSQLNSLYLSTIETLAMAIDAKDQITHGHIRRVQQYAVDLAKHLGITDLKQISAIEAASLLHDMGKLAVPEYILNKPGKLTPAEFERMKLHASIGADILSAIDFPYPVVPIVRHHHENWDGTGYPDGIRGTAIPIGARILSVVDCFDALTSDRPYRPRMSDIDAIRILTSRRGSMYDPIIVDTFIAIQTSASPHSTLAPDSPARTGSGEAAIPLAHANIASVAQAAAEARFDEISASAEETLVLYDLATGLTGQSQLREIGDTISKHLRRIIPTSDIVFFIYDVHSDHLVSMHAAGANSHQLLGLRIPRGERLSGWVAANKQTIVNADPILDLGDIARSLRPRLRSCISASLLSNDELIGVLTLYSADSDAFNENHKRLLEVVGRQVSQTLHQAVGLERKTAGASHTATLELADIRHLERVFVANTTGRGEDSVSVIFVAIRVPGTRLDVVHPVGDSAIEEVAIHIRKALRGGDLLFRYGSNEVAVLLSQADAQTADLITERTRLTLASDWMGRTDESRRLSASVGVATAPKDGVSVESLVRAAKERSRPITNDDRPPVVH